MKLQCSHAVRLFIVLFLSPALNFIRLSNFTQIA